MRVQQLLSALLDAKPGDRVTLRCGGFVAELVVEQEPEAPNVPIICPQLGTKENR